MGIINLRDYKPQYIVVERTVLEEGGKPTPEADQAMTELLLLVAKRRMLEDRERKAARPDYSVEGRGGKAVGHFDGEKFVVHAGACVAKKCLASLSASIRKIREVLMKSDVISQRGEEWVLKEDYVFDSPITAASVVLGRRSKLGEWKDGKGRTIKENQSAAQQAAKPETADGSC